MNKFLGLVTEDALEIERKFLMVRA